MAAIPMAERSVARNRNRRAQARSAPRATLAISFSVIPPCLRHFLGALRLNAQPLRSLLPGRPLRLLPSGFHDPDLLAVPDRIGRIGDDTLVLAQAAGDFDLRSEVARDMQFLEGDTVVKPDRRDLRRIVAKEQRAGGDPQRVRIGRDFKMDSRERTWGEKAVFVIGEE